MALRRLFLIAVSVIVLATPCRGQELFNWAADWNRASPEARAAYVKGFEEGLARAWVDIAFVLYGSLSKAPPQYQAIGGSYSLRGFGDQLVPVTTSLYADPANAYISIPDMILIARDRLAGENIDAKLESARRKAVIFSELAPKEK